MHSLVLMAIIAVMQVKVNIIMEPFIWTTEIMEETKEVIVETMEIRMETLEAIALTRCTSLHSMDHLSKIEMEEASLQAQLTSMLKEAQLQLTQSNLHMIFSKIAEEYSHKAIVKVKTVSLVAQA